MTSSHCRKAYDHRITDGEHNVESAWTMCAISPTLSFLCEQRSVRGCITACYRRALAYPLCRNWELIDQVAKDTQQIFALGKRAILRCILDVKHVLEKDEVKYVMNQLYLTDYCVWLQTARETDIRTLAKRVWAVTVEKDDVGFPLLQIEAIVNGDDAADDDSDDDSDDSDSDDSSDGSSDDSDDSEGGGKQGEEIVATGEEREGRAVCDDGGTSTEAVPEAGAQNAAVSAEAVARNEAAKAELRVLLGNAAPTAAAATSTATPAPASSSAASPLSSVRRPLIEMLDDAESGGGTVGGGAPEEAAAHVRTSAAPLIEVLEDNAGAPDANVAPASAPAPAPAGTGGGGKGGGGEAQGTEAVDATPLEGEGEGSIGVLLNSEPAEKKKTPLLIEVLSDTPN